MKAYELLFFVDPSITDEVRAGVMKRIEVTITAGGGAVEDVDNWGKRKLAFPVNKLQEGDYTLINFHADPTQIAELDRVLRINDAVQRHWLRSKLWADVPYSYPHRGLQRITSITTVWCCRMQVRV